MEESEVRVISNDSMALLLRSQTILFCGGQLSVVIESAEQHNKKRKREQHNKKWYRGGDEMSLQCHTYRVLDIAVAVPEVHRSGVRNSWAVGVLQLQYIPDTAVICESTNATSAIHHSSTPIIYKVGGVMENVG